jgi:hypothetical protein
MSHLPGDPVSPSPRNPLGSVGAPEPESDVSFFRPEAVAAVKRWREVAASVAVLLWGLWWGLTGRGLIGWIGWALVIGGAALTWAAAQRARFRPGEGGVGMVEVDERQITYLAPYGGAALAMENLTEVSIVPDRAGQPVWRLRAGGELMTIPAAAAGTEALFDVLTALPGADLEAAIRASRSPVIDRVVIWRRAH